MSKQTEALKMAIEALDDIELCDYQTQQKAIKACKEALEQPAQEPWGWYENHDIYDEKQSNDSIALYTHPAPSWQGLSYDEIKDIWFKLEHEIGTHISYGETLARAIEQALRIKNGL